MKLRALTIVLLLLSSTAAAETWDGRWGLGLGGGTWKQFGGNNDYSNFAPATGAQLRYGVSDALTLDIALRYGWTRVGVPWPDQKAGFTFDSWTALYTRILQPSLGTTYRLSSTGAWRPWVSAGFGVTQWSIRDLTDESTPPLWPGGESVVVLNEDGFPSSGEDWNATLIAGLGSEFVLGSRWSVDLATRLHYWIGQDIDSVGLSSQFSIVFWYY